MLRVRPDDPGRSDAVRPGATGLQRPRRKGGLSAAALLPAAPPRLIGSLRAHTVAPSHPTVRRFVMRWETPTFEVVVTCMEITTYVQSR